MPFIVLDTGLDVAAGAALTGTKTSAGAVRRRPEK
jgi:hypothetical protein